MIKGANEYHSKNMGMGMGGGMGRISLGKRTFSSFKNPVYRLFYGSMLCQMAAMNMQMITVSLLLYRLSGSAAILGLMSLASALPMLFLSLFGGVIADQVQKKYVLIIGMVTSAILTLGIALTLTLGYLSPEQTGSWWVLILSSVLQGIIFALVMPSRQAIIYEIVNEEQLMNAVSLNMLGMNSLRIAAPAIAGFLIDAIGFEAVYYTMTALNFLAIAPLALMPLTGTMTLGGGGVLANIREGLQYIRHDTIILLVLLFTLFTVILSMPYMTLMPLITEDILKVGATEMGILISVSGIGAVIGSLVLASLPNKKRGLMLLVGSLILGAALVGFAFSQLWTLSLALIAFVGLGQTVRMTLSNTLLQYYVDDNYRGRVMSILMMEFGLSSFGTFGAALLADTLGIQWAIGGFALVLVLLSILVLLFAHHLRRLD